jgi:hypothetical protein
MKRRRRCSRRLRLSRSRRMSHTLIVREEESSVPLERDEERAKENTE